MHLLHPTIFMNVSHTMIEYASTADLSLWKAVFPKKNFSSPDLHAYCDQSSLSPHCATIPGPGVHDPCRDVLFGPLWSALQLLDRCFGWFHCGSHLCCLHCESWLSAHQWDHAVRYLTLFLSSVSLCWMTSVNAWAASVSTNDCGASWLTNELWNYGTSTKR